MIAGPSNWIQSTPDLITDSMPQMYSLAYQGCPDSTFISFSVISTQSDAMVILGEASDGQNSFSLKQPVTVQVVCKDGHCLAENENLRIFVGGATLEEALQEFQLFLVGSWLGLKDEAVEELSGDALKLRETLASYFVG